jgi:beta-lactamase superfamily II metal-dependent hydrolase
VSTLTVRAYNVGFGDAILVTIPDRNPRTKRETMRSILIDVGTKKGAGGPSLDDLETVIQDIRRVAPRGAIDLYVMTHEHYDHVAGLFHAKDTWGLDVPFDYAWITASSDPGYHKRHPDYKKLREFANAYGDALERTLSLSQDPRDAAFREFLASRESQKTESCVRYLRQRAAKKTTYVHRESSIRPGKHHPFQEARLAVLAPERDTGCYFDRLNLLPFVGASTEPPVTGSAIGRTRPEPPPGVDRHAFTRLLDSWHEGAFDAVLAIDKAENNTSIVFTLEWRGWRLLFTGDAEQESWRIMHRRGLLKPSHFLKVSHHGSETGAPPDDALEAILPTRPPDRRSRRAVVSTYSKTSLYPGVPNREALNELRQRCGRKALLSTEDVPPGEPVVLEFSG